MTDAALAPSGWRRAEGARPLRAWRDAQRAGVAAVLEQAWREWQRAWGLASTPACAACRPCTHEDGEGDWQCVGNRSDAAGWLQLPGAFDTSLSRALWVLERVDTPIATAVQAQCRQDLILRIAAAVAVDAHGADEVLLPVRGGWSGALLVELPWGAGVLLNAHAVEALQNDAASVAAKRPPLVPVAAAVSGHAVPLRIHLADCELAIGSLRDLQPGDVLRLQHRLDVPLQVRDAAGRTLFSASLARRCQFKAVQLAPVPTGAPVSSKVPS